MKIMGFKKVYFCVCLAYVLFVTVKGSCLEYGHSCWGAHGKRSGTNKIFKTESKMPMEQDFVDLKDLGVNDKTNYDSAEEHMTPSPNDNLSPSSSKMAQDGKNNLVVTNDFNDSAEKSIQFKQFLYKQIHANPKMQQNLQQQQKRQQQQQQQRPQHYFKQQSSFEHNDNSRWQQLPTIYNNLRRMEQLLKSPVQDDGVLQLTGNEWLKELELQNAQNSLIDADYM